MGGRGRKRKWEFEKRARTDREKKRGYERACGDAIILKLQLVWDLGGQWKKKERSLSFLKGPCWRLFGRGDRERKTERNKEG